MILKFGFLYHLTVSSLAIWVTTGSENPNATSDTFEPSTMWTMLAVRYNVFFGGVQAKSK